MRRLIGFALAAVFAVVGLTACSGGDGDDSARRERRQAALVSVGAQGGARIQLTIDGITPAGQAMKLESYSWGANGPTQFGDLEFVKTMDSTSPKLFENLAMARPAIRAELKLWADADYQFLNYSTYTLEQVQVTSYQVGGQGNVNAIPVEQVSLSYARIRHETRMIKPDGTQEALARFGWDVSLRRAW